MQTIERQKIPELLLEALTQFSADDPGGVMEDDVLEQRALDVFARVPQDQTLIQFSVLCEAAASVQLPESYVYAAHAALTQRRRIKRGVVLGLAVIALLFAYLLLRK